MASLNNVKKEDDVKKEDKSDVKTEDVKKEVDEDNEYDIFEDDDAKWKDNAKNNEKRFYFSMYCGCGSKGMILTLKEDGTFDMKYSVHWMGGNNGILQIHGEIDHHSGNYYHLSSNKATDVENKKEYKYADLLTFELVALSQRQQMHSSDSYIEFVQSSNCGHVTGGGFFDAFLIVNPIFIDEDDEENLKILPGFLEDMRSCKIMRVKDFDNL